MTCTESQIFPVLTATEKNIKSRRSSAIMPALLVRAAAQNGWEMVEDKDSKLRSIQSLEKSSSNTNNRKKARIRVTLLTIFSEELCKSEKMEERASALFAMKTIQDKNNKIKESEDNYINMIIESLLYLEDKEKNNKEKTYYSMNFSKINHFDKRSLCCSVVVTAKEAIELYRKILKSARKNRVIIKISSCVSAVDAEKMSPEERGLTIQDA